MIIVVDYTRFTWFFLLKRKHEVLSVFKHFKALVKNQFSTKFNLLRIDNGTEYTNYAFQAFCLCNGILYQTSCPHSPQQNRVSKRKHRHIVEIGLSLLYRFDLPYNYWSYAFSTAMFLINRLPSFVLNFKSPLEVLYSKPPPLKALKAFGCACYFYLRPYNKNKLQPRSQECVFLGYPPLSKGYICLDPTSNNIYIACYALFNESLFPFAQSSFSTDPHTPFTTTFSLWFPQSQFIPSSDVVSLVLSNLSPHSAPISSSSSLDLIAFLLLSLLQSSSPIPVVPPPSVIPSSISTVPEPVVFPIVAPPSTDLAISNPNPSSSLPIPYNSHPMVTRSKHGIYISLKP